MLENVCVELPTKYFEPKKSRHKAVILLHIPLHTEPGFTGTLLGSTTFSKATNPLRGDNQICIITRRAQWTTTQSNTDSTFTPSLLL